MTTLTKALKVVKAGLELHQVAIVFMGQFATKSISGQGEELIFDDGSEVIVMDDRMSGVAYMLYDKSIDIYKCFDNEGREVF